MSGAGRAWTWRHLILKSDLPPTTRHVLLTLSCFMNDVGEGCYPTQEKLAEATGLTSRAVRTHLELAESKGWLHRDEHGFRGQRWRNTEYRALWPETQDVEEGAEARSAPLAASSGSSRQKVRKEVPTTSPDTSTPLNPPEETPDEEAQHLVAGTIHIHAVLDDALYRHCCAVAKHNPGVTDRRGGWMFSAKVLSDAKKRMGGLLV